MVSILLAMAFHQGSIRVDPRFAQPMTFDASLVPLPQLIGNISVMTGVTLKVDPLLENLKADVFLEDQSVGTTLANLADVFDLEWQASGDGYKLLPSGKAMADRTSYIDAEDQLVADVVQKQIAVYQLINNLVPTSKKPWRAKDPRFDSFIPAKNQAHRDLDSAKENGTSKEKLWDLEVTADALDKLCEGLPNLQLARIFSQMTTNDIARYRTGVPFIASNMVGSRFIYSRGDIRPNEDIIGDIEPKSVVFTRIDPGSKRIGFKEMTYVNNISAVGADPASHYPFEDIAPRLAKKPFAVSLTNWDQTSSLTKSMAAALVKDDSAVEGWPSTWYSKRFRLGDHLRWFHQVSGVPVIAAADRTIHPFLVLNRTAKSQGDYLNKLLGACNGFAHQSDGVLLVRDGVFWRKSAEEIPEELFAPLETQRKGKLGLADFVKFDNKISRQQAMLVQDNKGFVVNFRRDSFGEVYPILQLLGTLTPDQLEVANSKRGLTYTELAANQKDMFQFSLIEGVTGRAFISEPLLDGLASLGFDQLKLNDMLLHIGRSRLSAIYSAVTAVEDGKQLELIPRKNQPNRPTIDFEFGFDKRRMIKFSTEDTE